MFVGKLSPDTDIYITKKGVREPTVPKIRILVRNLDFGKDLSVNFMSVRFVTVIHLVLNQNLGLTDILRS